MTMRYRSRRRDRRGSSIVGFVRALSVVLGALVWSSAAVAQTPGVVAGVVRDNQQRPIENALVALDPNTDNQRVMRTDSTGRFRFDRVAGGPHELAVAWIGYRTVVRTIDVPAAGLELTIDLEQNVAAMDTLRIEARRTGIFGTVIAREGFRPLGGAEVQVIGINTTRRTRDDGKFEFGQAGPGSHVVFVKRNGYLSRMLSVAVPRDSAVELALVLDASEASGDRRYVQALAEFDRRRRWMTGSNATVVSRHELAGRSGMTLWDALRYSASFLSKGLVLDDMACIYMDGQFMSGMTAKDINMEGIEAVEVYGSGADYTNTVTRRHNNAPSRLPPGGMCGNSPPRDLSDATPMEQRVLDPSRGPRANPARVEAIVIWRRR
ncbi:MAG TPA: carboxypeptidase regulatory-like domain-containing protein [Gemmatimonadaceae bacterium]